MNALMTSDLLAAGAAVVSLKVSPSELVAVTVLRGSQC